MKGYGLKHPFQEGLARIDDYLNELGEVKDKACEEGDIKFSLHIETEQHNPDGIIHFISLEYLLSPGLFPNPFKWVESPLGFNSKVIPFDRATISHNGRRYHARQSSVLSVCRTIVDCITSCENEGKVVVLGTGYFNQFDFSDRSVTPSPNVYHSSLKQAELWKKYVLEHTS